jgi:hydrogenase maturation protein HypF
MSEGRTRASVRVTGIVQGVGFRPFVYRRATEHGLAGTVRNAGDAGVEISLEGPEPAIEAFLTDLRESPPPLSRVESVAVERRLGEAAGDHDAPGEFRILDSVESEGGTGSIPPDTGICEACLADLRDPDSRYHGYWATSCVDCGPRYTVIRDVPYDRPRTAMDAYPMCAACREEYEDPGDRRYHAQTIACPDCGPSLSLCVPEAGERRTVAEATAAIRGARERLANGELLAIKGIGGTHLACDATNEDAVTRLRDSTDRPAKPFATMAPSLPRVRSYASVSETEADRLEDVRRPIVLLDRADDGWLDPVAPGLHTVGVMLPYAGLHHLLFEGVTDGPGLRGPLVMTSGNRPGEPMAITTESLFEDLEGVIDAALVHDRAIVARCDDSVLRSVEGSPRFLRRSRGWVPEPLPRRRAGPPLLAVGAEFDATVALARDDEVFPSQHLGDVDGPATDRFVRNTVDHLEGLLGIEPAHVVCDLHPAFLTSGYARDLAEKRAGIQAEEPIEVQHHHAHAASLLGDCDRERAIVIAADGTGYGPDGTIWGGEVLEATLSEYERVGGLDTFRLPGGEAAIEEPARILASLLGEPDRIDDLLVDRTALNEDGVAGLRDALEAGVNAPETTSAGRFLDAMSALLDVCTERQYEGQPAIELEAAAHGHAPQMVSLPFRQREDRRVLDVGALARKLAAVAETEPTGVVAATAQDALARGLAEIAIEAAKTRDVDAIGFTGGVAVNEAISRTVRRTVESAGLASLSHEAVPPGDAGLSYGQALVATARLDDGG